MTSILITITLALAGVLLAVASTAAVLQLASIGQAWRQVVIAEALNLSPAILLARSVLRLRFVLLAFHAASIITSTGILAEVQYIGIVGLAAYAMVGLAASWSSIRTIRERSAENTASGWPPHASGTSSTE